MESPSLLCGKGRDLLIGALCDFIKVCIKMSKEATMPKMTNSFLKMWATLVVGPMYQTISTAAPFRDLIIKSWTTDSG